MSRPKSMSDFAALLDASMPPPLHPYDKSKEHLRKKPSVSLAAGLIMASTDSQTHTQTQTSRSSVNTSSTTSRGSFNTSSATSRGSANTSSTTPTSTITLPDSNGKDDNYEGWSDGLFYAYAQKDATSYIPPSVITFSSASIASQWWSLLQTHYPSSTRPSPQFFLLSCTDPYPDILDQIQSNLHFKHLQNKWFFSTLSASTHQSPALPIIPLQDIHGYPLAPSPAPASPSNGSSTSSPDLAALTTALSTLTDLLSTNTSQIHALSVAQSSGLATMQEINESTTSQIKSLTSAQSGLQSSVAANATHYLALSNDSFKAQEETRAVLQKTTTHLAALSTQQDALTKTCTSLAASLSSLAENVTKMHDSIATPTQTPTASTRSNSFALSTTSNSSAASLPFGISGNRISPPPRKLNRRIKGVWYEYDNSGPGSPTSTASPRRSAAVKEGANPERTTPKKPSPVTGGKK